MDALDHQKAGSSELLAAACSGQIAKEGPVVGSSGMDVAAQMSCADQNRTEQGDDDVTITAVEQGGRDSSMVSAVTGVDAVEARGERGCTAADESIHDTTITSDADEMDGPQCTTGLPAGVGGSLAGQVVEDTCPPASATGGTVSNTATDAIGAGGDGPLIRSAASETGSEISIEAPLESEPSLAHHASAVPDTIGNGARISIKVEIIGTTQQHCAHGQTSIVLDDVREASSAANVVDMLARRLNLPPRAIAMQISGQAFSGQMILPETRDPSGGITVVVHINESDVPVPVDLSAPATPMQLQVVVRKSELALCQRGVLHFRCNQTLFVPTHDGNN